MEKLTRREFFSKLLPGAEAAEKEPAPGPKWALVIDLARCIGCDTCTVACKAENRTPPGVTYNVVLTQERGEFPRVTTVHIPRPCMQCDRPPCAQVCPVKATYKLREGITAVDYDRCIGCRYCITACPYGARYFDFGQGYGEEMLGYDEIQSPEYGVQRGRRSGMKAPKGVVRKCHFCFHRLLRGEEPACVEVCLGDARYFGDLNNPDSVVSQLAQSPRAFFLKEEMGTHPRVIYLK